MDGGGCLVSWGWRVSMASWGLRWTVTGMTGRMLMYLKQDDSHHVHRRYKHLTTWPQISRNIIFFFTGLKTFPVTAGHSWGLCLFFWSLINTKGGRGLTIDWLGWAGGWSFGVKVPPTHLHRLSDVTRAGWRRPYRDILQWEEVEMRRVRLYLKPVLMVNCYTVNQNNSTSSVCWLIFLLPSSSHCEPLMGANTC